MVLFIIKPIMPLLYLLTHIYVILFSLFMKNREVSSKLSTYYILVCMLISLKHKDKYTPIQRENYRHQPNTIKSTFSQ